MRINELAGLLVEMLSIKSDNPYVLDDMIQELNIISDLKSFLSYLKAKITTVPYKYLNGYQKFMRAIADYKNLGSESKDEVIEKYCQKLLDKIRTTSRAIDENLPSGLRFNDFAEIATFDNFKTNGVCAFTIKEQQLLNEVGSCKVWLLTFDDNDFLLKLMRAIGRLNQKQLAPKEKMLSLEDIKNKGVRDD